MTETIEKPSPRPNRRRRIAFAGGGVILVGLIAEAISAIGLRFSMDTAHDFQDLRQRQELLAIAPRGADDSMDVVHPFTGWCVDPQISKGDEVFGKHLPVNQFGFIDDQESVQRRGDDRLIIGITGGSVAWQMTVGADDVIRDVLRQSPLLHDRDIRILRIGLSGYKQPQQLMTANWLMALGGEFDAIVNLDGYNELALSITDNYMRKIHTAYPRAWNARMTELIDPRQSADRMRLLEIAAGRQRNAQRIISVPWRWSFTTNAVWLLSDRVAVREKTILTQGMMKKHATRNGLLFAESGPPQDISSVDEALEISADTWLRCSVQMHRLLSNSGVAYLHVLQPNLYHIDSKPLSSEELELVGGYLDNAARAIKDGYPLLLARQPKLEASGVEFLDLSGLYAEEQRTMYSDHCCHFNEEGNDILARAIAIRLREVLENSQVD